MTSTEAQHGALKGTCLCGEVAYDVADQFRYAMYCHCSLCRRMTGSAFKALAGIERNKLVVTKGEEALRRYGGDSWHNVNCGRCGSLLFAVVREGRFVHLAMGTLVDAPTIRPSMHVFVGSKAPWFEITDDLPQFEGSAPP